MTIIGVSGFAGSGKDTSADFLAEERGFVKVSLADPLKRICRDVYAFTDEQLWGPSQFRNEPDKRYPRQCPACPAYAEEDTSCPNCDDDGLTYLTPREALQKLGTEWGRHCYENTWVDKAIRTAESLLAFADTRYDQKKGLYTLYRGERGEHDEEIKQESTHGVAIPDVRFRNEIDAIQKVGGKVIRVVRPGSGLDGAYKMHQSEAEMASIPDSLFDLVIQNDGALDDLRYKIIDAVA